MKTPGTPSNVFEIRAEQALRAFSVLENGSVTYRPAMPAVASPSYQAVESCSFEVAVDGAAPAYFLRFGIDEVKELVDDDIAFAAADRLHQLGFSPEPVDYDNETQSILFARLDENWRSAKIDDLMHPDRAAQLVEMQKTIAGGELFGRRWSVFDGIELLWHIVSTGPVPLPGDADWMLSWMKPMREAIQAAGVDIRPAHGDPHSSNVMLGPDGALQLVDFDMAGDMDPYYQLGVQMNELYQFETAMKPLLEIHDGAFSEKAFNRCRIYAAADDFYWALRSLILEMRSPPRGIEFLKYAGWRFLRCRMALGHPDFEGRLRNL